MGSLCTADLFYILTTYPSLKVPTCPRLNIAHICARPLNQCCICGTAKLIKLISSIIPSQMDHTIEPAVQDTPCNDPALNLSLSQPSPLVKNELYRLGSCAGNVHPKSLANFLESLFAGEHTKDKSNSRARQT